MVKTIITIEDDKNKEGNAEDVVPSMFTSFINMFGYRVLKVEKEEKENEILRTQRKN